MVQIKSDRLCVAVCAPGEGANTTFRVDRAGFISNVVLDGNRYFCGSEPNNLAHTSSGGRELCSEFTFDASGEASVGGYFPKLGISLLKKESEVGYVFHNRYESEPFEITAEASPDMVTFTTAPKSCIGYAARQKKTLTVRGSVLEMQMELENVGEKKLAGGEYCHNFFSIDGMAIGPAYRVELLDMKRIPREVHRSGVSDPA